MEYHTTESRELRGVEEAGCKILQWCPNGQPDYGIDKKKSAACEAFDQCCSATCEWS